MNITEAQKLADQLDKFSGGDTTTWHWQQYDIIYQQLRDESYDVCSCGDVFVVREDETSCYDCWVDVARGEVGREYGY